MSGNDTVSDIESNWVIVRLLDSFSNAIYQQSKEDNSININNNINNEGASAFISYWMSPFSMMCMITAVIMNRIVIFASSRRNNRLPLISNIILRIFAIYLLLIGSYEIFLKLWDYNTTSTTDNILKSLHLSLCISQIFDTFISVASGLKPSMETGITLFEYSLAFQEIEKSTNNNDNSISIEILIIAIISILNQLNIHLLGLFNLLNYKLITSTIIGLFTLGFYSYNLINGSISNLPVIIIIGYLPHFCILNLIILSLLIYLTTGLVKFSFNDLLINNLLINWNSINISLSDDFYTALIKFGEFILNLSINQCYIRETSNIYLPIDNFIQMEINNMKNKINKNKNMNGYNNEIINNPELMNIEKQNDEIKKISVFKWVIFKRLKIFNNVVMKFIKLIVLKIIGIFRKRNNDRINDNNNSNNNNKVVKYRIIEDDNGVKCIYLDNDNENNDNDNNNNDKLNINEINDEDLNKMYSQLLLNTELPENDESNDYQESDDDNEDDYDEDIPTDNESIVSDEEIQELFTNNDINHILTDMREQHIMTYHMSQEKEFVPISQLTRSNFSKYYTDDMKLLDYLIERRLKRVNNDNNKETFNNDDSCKEINDDQLGICVVCHENSRQIVLWPCRCLAICESCRVSLFIREFATCVCCRGEVEGFSRIYVP